MKILSTKFFIFSGNLDRLRTGVEKEGQNVSPGHLYNAGVPVLT
jgi:hypothetical protein